MPEDLSLLGHDAVIQTPLSACDVLSLFSNPAPEISRNVEFELSGKPRHDLHQADWFSFRFLPLTPTIPLTGYIMA
jgi:hypothetical protein